MKGAKPIFVVGTCRDAFTEEQLQVAHALIHKEVLKTSPCLPFIRKSKFDGQLTHFIDNTKGRVVLAMAADVATPTEIDDSNDWRRTAFFSQPVANGNDSGYLDIVTKSDGGEETWAEDDTITQLRIAIDDESVSCIDGCAFNR